MGRPWELFTTRPDSSDSRHLDPENARLLAVSSRAELALMLRPRRHQIRNEVGTLARPGSCWRTSVSPTGVSTAWELAVVKVLSAKRTRRIEYPRGKSIYQASGRFLNNARVSRRGDMVAFSKVRTLIPIADAL